MYMFVMLPRFAFDASIPTSDRAGVEQGGDPQRGGLADLRMRSDTDVLESSGSVGAG